MLIFIRKQLINNGIDKLQINIKRFDDKFATIEEQFLVKQIQNNDNLYRIFLKTDDIYRNIIANVKPLVKLSDLVILYNGIATGTDKDKYIADNKINENYKPLVFGNNVQYYYFTFDNTWINYDREILHRAREEKIFLAKEKIIMQRIRNIKLERRLVATLDTEQYYTFNSINNLLIKDENYNLRYILALLNSKLINYLIKKLSINTNLTAQDLDTIPFRAIDFAKNNELKMYQTLVDSVNKILSKTKQNTNADISEEQTLIDNIVYKLYSLTDKEIEIVNGIN